MLNSSASDLFVEALRAEKPHPAHAEKLALFGQFVGKWEMDIKFFDETGNTIYHQPGEWIFSWVLDGWAVQDVLTNPAFQSNSQEGAVRRSGSTLRYYDIKHDFWRAVWVAPVSGFFIVLTGKQVGEKIVLEGSEAEGILNRLEFSDITGDSFHWTGFISYDNGKTWRIEQEMWAKKKF